MNRRGFLQSILVGAAAPAIVRADWLMPIVVRPEFMAVREVRAYNILTDQMVLRYDTIVHGARIFQFACGCADDDNNAPRDLMLAKLMDKVRAKGYRLSDCRPPDLPPYTLAYDSARHLHLPARS